MLQFPPKSIAADDRAYIAYHAPRYAFLLRLLAEYNLTSSSTLLDIGPSRLTDLIREGFGVAADSLGLGQYPTIDGGRHLEFDLNLTQNASTWRRDMPTYEFVVMAEVLEHLYTAPQLVLAFVKTLIVENGLLILQTPNAASFQKRFKLLLGRNPYEMIRVDTSNPGHFREYTIAELNRLAKKLGFSVERCVTAFYFDARFARHADGQVEPQFALGSVKNSLYRLLPKNLREGITMVWRKLPQAQ
jgi:methyltransferase family protein